MNKSKYVFISVIFILSILHFSTHTAMADIINGFFTDPPGPEWTYSSEGVDVYSDSTAGGDGYAELYTVQETEASVSDLYQDNIFLLTGETQLLFDVIMKKSVAGAPQTDTFTAIFGSEQYTLLSSDFIGNEYSETVVFDLTGWASGPYTLSFQLENEWDYISTSVEIDNIRFVPVPGAFLLAAIGLLSSAASRKLKA